MKGEIRAGVIISFVVFLWLLLEYYLGFHTRYIDYYPFFTWLYIIVPVIGIYVTVRWKRNRVLNGLISFSEALTSGLVVTAVTTILVPIFTLLYVTIINPYFFDTMIAHRRIMIEELNISAGDKTIMLNRTLQSYTIPYYLLRTFIVSAAVGLIPSIIIAATIKKDAREEQATPEVDLPNEQL